MKADVCARTRAEISLLLDGAEIDGATLEDHLTSCPACRGFERDARALRQQLRYERLDAVPDVAGAVAAIVARDGTRPAARPGGARRRLLRPSLVAVAAAFLVGVVLGATLVSDNGTQPGPAALADLPERVADAQHHLRAVDIELSLVERGWHRDVPERRWDGTLRWSAPETLQLALTDRTVYPSEAWVPDDVQLVIDEDTAWSVGPRDCPAEAQPTCTPAEARVEVTTGREPFADGDPLPLDLVLPVRSFAGAGEPEALGERAIAGRDALGIATTAAQVQPVLDGLHPAGNLRHVHPADRVELWLDAETMVPLALRVIATDVPGRAGWAATRGYHDGPGDRILELDVTRIAFEPDTIDPIPPPTGGAARSSGFVTGAPDDVLAAARVPGGFRRHRAGTVESTGPQVAVVSWSDGRAWLKVRATREWPGSRLFGDLGPAVRPVSLDGRDLEGQGVAYANSAGDRVGIHGDGIDLVVSGSVGEATLVAVAASLGIEGLTIPDDWEEAATASLDEARNSLPGLLVPKGLRGFGPPSIRVQSETVILQVSGPGSRAFSLTQSPGARLAPPLDLSVTGVEVRGREGRWSVARGELEWAEGGRVIVLRSDTLSLNELLAVAESLEAS